MGNMMGGNWGSASPVQTQVTTQNAIFPLVGFAALIGAAAMGTSGAIYYFTGSKIRITEPVSKTIVDQTPQNTATPYASVSKTLTTEERKVLDVLISHKGKYLQKYIRAETGLSRLKTHRIVSRLAERGIVTLERSGNTNEVHLSSWLQNKPYPNAKNDKQTENKELMVEA
jgi:predicted transcriptional regulator